jgi:ribosomal protein L3 glutamine methyltransferase
LPRHKATKARPSRPRAAAPDSSTPTTVAELIRNTAMRLKKAKVVFAHGTSDPVAEAAFMVGEAMRVPPGRIEALGPAGVTAAQRKRVAGLVDRRIRTRKPAAYLLSRIYLRGVRFAIDERAIVPRSYLAEILDGDLFAGETYSLVRDPAAVGGILDLCTGSGCLAVLAALRFPRAQVDAVELSAAALKVARKNVADHRLKGRIKLIHGDLFAPLRSKRYDLIVANPPYVDAAGMARLPPECRHEPRLAFDGGADGLALVRRILEQAGRHLTPSGGLLCEVGRGRRALERAYPGQRFLWLDTEESTGEVFWLDAAQLR